MALAPYLASVTTRKSRPPRKLDMQLAKAKSVTHSHLLSIVNTEAGRAPHGRLRLLDVGCGRGEFLMYLMRNLPLLRPSLELECYGFDVSDSGMMLPGFVQQVIAELSCANAKVDWSKRISLIRSTDPWPYPDDFFDVIVSNQVIEHVDDHELFFSELKRTLKEGGYSAHLFPLEQCIWEWHVRLPCLHWMRNHDSRVSYIRLMVRLGLKKPILIHPDEPVSNYSGREADVMRDFTNYLSQRDVYKLGKKLKLRTSFRYTQEFYYQKLRSLARLQPRLLYRPSRLFWIDFFSVLVLRYLAAVTLFLEKRRGIPHETARLSAKAPQPAADAAFRSRPRSPRWGRPIRPRPPSRRAGRGWRP
jgi:SAM-dependent methyltransferase